MIYWHEWEKERRRGRKQIEDDAGWGSNKAMVKKDASLTCKIRQRVNKNAGRRPRDGLVDVDWTVY